MKKIEAKFYLSRIGIWYRRGKMATWILCAICVVAIIALLKFVPSCHLLHLPAARGCDYAGIKFDDFISFFAFFNVGLIIGLAALLQILKYILIFWFVLRSRRL